MTTIRRARGLHPLHSERKINLILQVISNRTRRNILSFLSEEPMYFNQLAGRLNVGQQAILRHMELLERSGLVETYQSKSTLGAPDRKYYKVKSSFNLTVSLSRHFFTLVNREIEGFTSNEDTKSYNALNHKIKKQRYNDSLYYIREIINDIEDEITDLEIRSTNLKLTKQRILSHLNDMYQDMGLELTERRIVRAIIKESPSDIRELMELIEMSRSDLDEAMLTLSAKLDSSDGRILLKNYVKNKNTFKS